MLVKEFYEKREDGVNLYRTYSNENFKIRQMQTGNIYEEAIDPVGFEREYIETDIPIEKPEENIEE